PHGLGPGFPLFSLVRVANQPPDTIIDRRNRGVGMRIRGIALAVATIAATTALTTSAHATTFCVPSFRPDCPNIAGNVATANVETGMQTNASDGAPDRIEIASGTNTDTDSFATGGPYLLEIVGAGIDQVRLTTSSTANIFVVNLYFQ